MRVVALKRYIAAKDQELLPAVWLGEEAGRRQPAPLDHDRRETGGEGGQPRGWPTVFHRFKEI